jgi:hypothetical protein
VSQALELIEKYQDLGPDDLRHLRDVLHPHELAARQAPVRPPLPVLPVRRAGNGGPLPG